MTIPGPIVHQQLMTAYHEMQTSIEEERGEIVGARSQRDTLGDERVDALVSLAEHYLPELTPESIESTWHDAQPELRSLLLRKEDHQRRLQEQLESGQLRYDESESRYQEANTRYEDAIKRQHDLTQQCQERLREDAEFVRLSDRAAVAEGALERAEANLAEIDQDAARKLPSYEQSSLFRYLHDRGFGTDAYAHRGFTRRMDRSLAKFIGYAKAKSGYEFLKRTPDQMRTIIADDREALGTVMLELEKRRDNIAAEIGLTACAQECDEAETDRHERLEVFETQRQRIESDRRELAELDNTRGTYYREAIEQFRKVLEKAGTHNLKERARITSEITDDQIVARILGVERDIDELNVSAQSRHDEMMDDHQFLAGLGRVLQRFRAAKFDSARSNFVQSFSVSDELAQAKEVNDPNYLWQRIRKSQRWGPVVYTSADRSNESMDRTLTDDMAYAAGNKMGSLARRAGYRHAQRKNR